MVTYSVMPISEIIDRVTAIARQCNVKHLSLFGSFANGTATEQSDIDFIVEGCRDMDSFLEKIDDIPTLRKIDIFDYNEVCNRFLREDMDKYGRKIF